MFYFFVCFIISREKNKKNMCLVRLNISCFISSLCLHKKAKVLSIPTPDGFRNKYWTKWKYFRKNGKQGAIWNMKYIICNVQYEKSNLRRYASLDVVEYLWVCTVHLITTRAELCILNWTICVFTIHLYCVYLYLCCIFAFVYLIEIFMSVHCPSYDAGRILHFELDSNVL